MNNTSQIYMTLDEYNDFITKAHATYMANRLQQTITDTHKKFHPSDLAIETASFFEASYVIIDSYLEVVSARLIAQDKEQKRLADERWKEIQEQGINQRAEESIKKAMKKEAKQERKQVKER